MPKYGNTAETIERSLKLLYKILQPNFLDISQ